jgi:hypothetical protein
MSATLTLTGVAGPAQTVTATVFTDVTTFTIDAVNNVISFKQGSVNVAPIAITSATTITATKSGSTYTLTIS